MPKVLPHSPIERSDKSFFWLLGCYTKRALCIRDISSIPIVFIWSVHWIISFLKTQHSLGIKKKLIKSSPLGNKKQQKVGQFCARCEQGRKFALYSTCRLFFWDNFKRLLVLLVCLGVKLNNIRHQLFCYYVLSLLYILHIGFIQLLQQNMVSYYLKEAWKSSRLN